MGLRLGMTLHAFVFNYVPCRGCGDAIGSPIIIIFCIFFPIREDENTEIHTVNNCGETSGPERRSVLHPRSMHGPTAERARGLVWLGSESRGSSPRRYGTGERERHTGESFSCVQLHLSRAQQAPTKRGGKDRQQTLQEKRHFFCLRSLSCCIQCEEKDFSCCVWPAAKPWAGLEFFTDRAEISMSLS